MTMGVLGMEMAGHRMQSNAYIVHCSYRTAMGTPVLVGRPNALQFKI